MSTEARTDKPPLPLIIQGGMGVGISNWELARAVAIAGRDLDTPVLGVVSGTGVEVLLIRRLQDGDPGGHMRRALAAFPSKQIAGGIIENFFIKGGKKPDVRYKDPPKPADLIRGPERAKAMNELSVVANFVEVWLARESHCRPIGINHLEKIQLLHLPRLFGAMLAGVDYVLEGAGIPYQVPGVLDRLANLEPAQYKVDVFGSGQKLVIGFDPATLDLDQPDLQLTRPVFLAIIASNLLAKILSDKNRISGKVDGFVVEGPTAGGHNAPPRIKEAPGYRGEPVYGKKDEVNLVQIGELGLPYWLAGSYGSPEQLGVALASGAAGIQAGTIFALSEESGMEPKLKNRIRRLIDRGELTVITSRVSPTGYPFKVANVPGTLSEQDIFDRRRRMCIEAHLVEPYQASNNKIGLRCSAEPIKAYLQKRGKLEDTKSNCLCSGLIATAGYPQLGEPPIVTLGDDVASILRIPRRRDGSYTARDALAYLLGK